MGNLCTKFEAPLISKTEKMTKVTNMGDSWRTKSLDVIDNVTI